MKAISIIHENSGEELDGLRAQQFVMDLVAYPTDQEAFRVLRDTVIAKQQELQCQSVSLERRLSSMKEECERRLEDQRHRVFCDISEAISARDATIRALQDEVATWQKRSIVESRPKRRRINRKKPCDPHSVFIHRADVCL